MLTTKKITQCIGVSLLFPALSFAATETGTTAPAESTPSTSSATTQHAVTQVPKDEWLKKIKEVVSEPICKGFMEDASISTRLKEQNISLEKCVTLIPPIAEKCEKKYYDSVPAMITEENAGKWGRMIGECIGADFAVNYLYPGSSTSEAPKNDMPSTTSESTTPAAVPAH
jgi:hypothetical protein